MAGMQRSWRRAWGQSKSAWQNKARVKLGPKPRKTSDRIHNDLLTRRRKLMKQVAASIAAMQLLGGLGIDSAYAASNITIDNRTATQLDVQGNVTNIHTDTFSSNGVNAFNSFKDFSVTQGDIVNLHFSNLANTMTATNLLNYVTGGSASNIDGMLNGIKNGQIGGNVYLLNPSGIMVGATGVVNVGSLTLSASTPLVGQLDPEMSIDNILADIPTGDIVINGKVNTVTGANLFGKTISNSGVIQTGAAFSGSAVDFSDIVNVNDLQYGTKLAVENGNIVISASDSVTNTGTISAHSTSNTDVVKIIAPSVTLSGNILTGGASLDVKATDSITVNNDALLSTRQVASDSTLVNIKSGTASGVGKSGNVSLAVNHTTYKDRANIEINKAVIDASGTGVAGTSGDVSIVASSQDQLFAWAMTGPDAQVTVADSTIKGNNVAIQAVAKNDATDSPTFDELNDVDDAKNNASLDNLKNSESSIGDTLVSTLGNLRVGVSVSNVHAKATVTLDDKTKIVADKDVLVGTTASSAVNSMLISVVGGAGVGFSDAQALTNINSGAGITAGGNVDVAAATKNTINMSTKAIPVVAGLVPLNMMVTYANMTSNASAVVGSGASIDAGGSVNVAANSIKDMTTAASASAAGGYFSAGVAISDSDVDANAEIAGKVQAAGDITVDAKVDTVQNNTWAEASVGDGEPGSGLDLAVDWISNSFGVWAKDKLGLGKPPKKVPPSVGITGAVAVTLSDDNASAKITSTGMTTLTSGGTVANAVQSLGDISVTSDVTDIMKTAAIAQQKQREENNVLNNPTDANKKAAGVSAAVIYGQYNNTSDAYIGDNAVVDAKQKLTVNSSVNIPFTNNWSDIDKITTNLSNAFLSSNLGLDKAMFTSWAQASSEADKGTGSASVDIMNYTNKSNAYIGKGALINQDKVFNSDQTQNDVSVTAQTNITTLDLAGMLKSPLDNLIQAARDKTDPMLSAFGSTSGGTGVGGSVLVTLEDNTTKAYIDAGSKVSAHNLTVDAATNIKNISIGAAGGKAADIGFNGTATVNMIDDTTYAQIINAADVTAADDITIKAVDDIYNIDAAGAVTESSSTGVGVSIAYNDITRDTQASVSGTLTVDDSLNVKAANSGGIVTVSLAGSVTADKPAEPQPDEEDKDPVEYIRYLFADEDAPDASDPLAKPETKLPGLVGEDASGNKPEAGLSVAGNVSINVANEQALAFVGDNSATPVTTTIKAKTSNVEAKNDSGIYAISGAVAIAANADPNSKGIAGAFMLNKVNETTQAYADNATIETTGIDASNGLSLQAINNADIVSIAASGGVAPSGKAIAGQVSLNMLDNTTSAYVDSSNIITANDLTIAADDNATITAVGGAVAYGGSAGFGASIAVNLMDNTTEAYINNSQATGTNNESDVSVAATEESTITSVTAAVGGSRGSMAGAFSASGNALTNTTKAYIAGSKVAGGAAVDTKGSVAVAAQDISPVTTIAGAGAVAAGGVGAGASTTVLATINTVSAYIGDNTKINALGLGAGLAVDGQTITGLAVAAKSDEEVVTLAAGGAGGGSAGIAGSATVNVLNQQSDAYIGKNAVINAINTGAGIAQDVSVTAVDTTSVTGLAGALAIGKTAGVGVGVSTEVITTDTEAYIDSGAAVTARNNVLVEASDKENVTSFAGGITGGGNAGIAGAANVHVMNTTTQAYIGRVEDTIANAANVSADSNVAVTAKDDSTLNLIAGTAAYGSSAGIGASLDTNIVTKTTAASIGDNAVVQAKGSGAGIAVGNGTFAITYEDYGPDSFKTPSVSTKGNGSIDDQALVQERKAAAQTNTVKGVAVAATSQNTIRSVAIGAGASGSVAVTGSASINVVTNTTSAYVGKNANINQSGGAGSEQSVLVAAGSDYFNLGVDGAGAVAIDGAGVGAGADISILNNTTKAYIDDGARVAAAKDIAVKATAEEEVISIAAALGASGEVGVAGAVGVNVITNETKAFIGNQAVVAAQNNLAVNAQDDTRVISIAGGAGIGIGTAGVGGSVSATVINKDTAAYIGSGATVDAEAKLADDQLEVYTGEYDSSGNKLKNKISGLSVNAQSSEKITDVVASGGGGLYAGVAGSVAVNIDKAKTQAYIAENAQINTANQTVANAKQGVSVAAVNDVTMLSVSGAAGGGAVGVSGGVDVGIVQNDTTAYLGNNAVLNAKNDFALTAMADKDISSNAVSISGGAVGVAGSVSVYALGTNLSTDAQAGLQAKKDSANANNPQEDNVQGYVDGQIKTAKYSNLLQSYDNQNVKSAAATLNQSTQAINLSQVVENTTAVPGGTAAFTGTNAKINVGNNFAIKAREKLDFNSKVGAAALGGVAVGGAVSVISADNNADAHVGSGTEIIAGQDVLVNGSLHNLFNVHTLAGSAGMSTALAGSGVYIGDDSTATAYLDNVTKLTAANLRINAASGHDITGQAIGGAAAYTGLALAGAVVVGDVTGSTTAYLGNATDNSNNTISVSGNIEIAANTTAVLDGAVIAPAVGSFAGGAGVVNVKDDSDTQAFIGKNMSIQRANNINITAEATPKILADATVISGGIGALGASVAIAEAQGSSQAYVGEGVQIGQEGGNTVGSLTVQATQSRQNDAKNAVATAQGGAIGGIAAQGIVTEAKVSPEVTAYTGQTAKISTTGQVLVKASADPQGNANSTGINAGGVAVGVSTAMTEITPVITAAIGQYNTLSADSLTVQAQLLRQNDANSGDSLAIAAGGGLVGVNATVSDANSEADVTSVVGDNSTLTITNAVNIEASADTKQNSKATAIAVGYYAAGANSASASSNNDVQAYLGKNVTVNGGKDAENKTIKSGAVSVTATGTDDNFAESKAGVGGVVAGSAAVAITNTKGTTKAYIDEAANIMAAGLNVNAVHTSLFNAKVDSSYASLVGASGVVVNHTVDTDVLVDIGDLASITTANDVSLKADNISRKGWLKGVTDGDDADWNISAAGGGAISGAAVVETINVTHDAVTTVDTGAGISTGDDGSNGSFIADAASNITVHDKARINTGGAISAAVVDSRINAISNTSVTIDAADVHSKTGTVKAGTKGSADLDNRVAVDVYGLAGAPAGTAYSNYTGTNTLTVKPNAKLTTDTDDIVLAAGQDTAGNAGIINANATVNLWNKTVVPITITPNPQANVISNSTVDIQAASNVGSAQDIYLTADKGNISATYTGVGKDLYREALAEVGSAISNLFGGGDVNLDVKGGSRSVGGTANVVVNGTVETGIKRVQELSFGGSYQEYTQDGTTRWRWIIDPAASEGVTYSTEYGKAIAESMTDRLNQLYKLKAAYAGDTAATGAYSAEILFLQEKMVSMGLATWNTANGGKVFVPGSSAGSNAISPKAAAEASLAEIQEYKMSVDTKVDTQTPITQTAKTYRDLVQTRDTASNTLTAYITNTDNFTLTQRPTSEADAKTKLAELAPGNSLISKYQQAIVYYDNLAAAKTAITTTNSSWNPDIAFTDVQKDYETKNGELTILTGQQGQLANSIISLTSLIPTLSDTVPTGPTADFITVRPITARLGDIKVKADNLTGSGKLIAPGDAKITITNNSPSFLTVNDLIVRDGGSILFNGAYVKSDAAINALNTGKTGAAFTAVTTKANTDKPSITITSTFDPNAPANKKPLGTSGVSVALAVAPDITLAQDSEVSNVNGLVKVESAYGSIYSNGAITAGTVDIKANNGDFVQSYVDGFDNIGGDPEQIYHGLVPKGITANGNIFISARYLNINGYIESGIADWDLALDNNVNVLVNGAAATLDQAQADYKANGGTGFYQLSSGYSGNIGKVGYVSYDAINDRFEISGVEVHGGYVQLYGQIINTAEGGTNTGKVRALDGYGAINITNNSGRDLVLNNLDTGDGAAGIIDITDIQNSSGTAIHTRYTSNRGEVTVEQNGIPVTPQITSTANDRSTLTYNPQSNLFYNWTIGQDYSYTQYYRFESEDVFGYTYKAGTTPAGSPTYSNAGVPKPLDDGIYVSPGRPYNYSLFIDGYMGGKSEAEWNASYYTTRLKTIDTGVGAYNKIREWTTRDWYTFGITGTYHQDYSITTPKKDITTYSVKASNPISIEFFGNDSGTVTIDGNNAGSVLLQGAITNKEGLTSISTGKDILQADSSALITTGTLKLDANGDIGSNDQSVRAIMSDTLNAASATGNVNVTQVLGDLNLGTVTADTGTLRLTADGSIANAAISDVRGQRIELTSNNGSIGDMAAPLLIKTGTTTAYLDPAYGLKASAFNDINITNQVWTGKNSAGDMLIDTVESRTGDVTLTTPGQMIDNNIDEQIDDRTWDKLTDYWDSLQLRAGEDSNAEKQAQTITSYANGKTADYQTYWQLKDHMSNGQYICTDAEKATLISQGVDTDAFVTSQTERYQKLETQGVGAWNSGTYDANFAYTISDAEKTQLLKGSSWTERELAISLSPGALKELTDTNPVIKAPNVKGKNVTLNAGAGIGSNVTLAGIYANTLPENLTPEQKVALAAAERADLVLDNVSNIITITQRKPVNIETAGGVLNATAGEYAYLGSEKTVLLDQITAGTGYDVRLKVDGGIVNGDPSNANIYGQNVILEAATGGIGTEVAPLELHNDGTLTARAAQNIFLQKAGDIKLDTMYSLAGISLDATGNIQTDYDDDKISIMSNSLKLKAKQVGTDSKPLGISVATQGTLTVATESDIHLNNISSKLNISAATSTAGNIAISASNDMTANNIQATAGSINLTTGGKLNADMIKAPGSINLIAGQDMTAANIESVAGSIDLNATGNLNADTIKAFGVINIGAGQGMTAANIEAATGSIDLNATGDLNASAVTASGVINLTAGGAMTAGNIESTADRINLTGGGELTVDAVKALAGDINVQATGNILNGASDNSRINLTARDIDLTSTAGGIGQSTKPVTVSASGTVTATAQQDINLISNGDLLADQMSSQAGLVNVAVVNGSNLHIIETNVAEGMNVRGDNVALDNVIHTGNALLTMDISGSSKPMADTVTVNVTSPQGVQFNNLIANNALINAHTDFLELNNTIIGSRADVTNNYYTVTANNNSLQSLFGSDVLLRPLATPYNLLMNGKNIFTDTTVLNYQGGIMVNGSATEDSAVSIADKVVNGAYGIDLSPFGIAGSLLGSSEGLRSGSLNPENLVDITQIMNTQTIGDDSTGNENQESDDENISQ